MALISETIPNLINGVSQQPAPIRIPTACEEAVNCYMSVVSGLQKRQHSHYLATLESAASEGDVATHIIKRSDGEEHLFVVSSNGLEVFDLKNGSKLPVTGHDTDYLKQGIVSTDLSFASIADHTFVLNKSIATAASDVAETSTNGRKDPTSTASIFIKRAVASTTYAVYVNGELAMEYATNDNTTAENALEGTAEIAKQLLIGTKEDTTRVKIRDASKDTDDESRWGEVVGSVLTFEKTNPDDVVTVLDQYGGAAMRIIEDSIQEFSDLPPTEVNGRLVKVVGDADAEGDDYWVRFNGKVWVEDRGWQEGRTLDASLMPHKIVPHATGYRVEPSEWGGREVGDSESNADPTFVGKTINSMFLYKGRMCFLSDENLIMSEVSSYENFYRTSVTQLLDTDRIDVASTTGQVNILRHAVAFGDSLVLFSDRQQFKVTQGEVLSPATIGLQPTTAYDGSPSVAPVNSGPNVFFVTDGPRFAIVREMYIDQNNGEQFDAAEITIQVPKYIPTKITNMAVSTYEDVLVLHSQREPNTLYIYKWFLDGKRKVQSSWSKWKFDEGVDILGLDFVEQDLVLVYRKDSYVRLDKISLEESVALVDRAPVLLDHQVDNDSMEITFDPVRNVTTFELPYQDIRTIQFWTKEDPYGLQILAEPVGTDGDTYEARGNWVTNSEGERWQIVAGRRYEFEFTFSDQFVRKETSGGLVAAQDGRLQLRYMSLIYQNTSYFEVEVTPHNRAPRTYKFAARTLADHTNVFDTVPIETGEFRFPILAQNTKVLLKIKSSKPFPCAFGLAEWDALIHPRTSRIT